MRIDIPGWAKPASLPKHLALSSFSSVFSLRFFKDDETPGSGYSLVAVLETDQFDETYQLCIRFTGVQNLNLAGFGCLTQITGFSIEDVSDHQLEGIHFRVSDYENDVLRFWCKTAEVIAAGKRGL